MLPGWHSNPIFHFTCSIISQRVEYIIVTTGNFPNCQGNTILEEKVIKMSLMSHFWLTACSLWFLDCVQNPVARRGSHRQQAFFSFIGLAHWFHVLISNMLRNTQISVWTLWVTNSKSHHEKGATACLNTYLLLVRESLLSEIFMPAAKEGVIC